ncbi:MAG: hypothetical protein ACF8PN_01365 [Phycisphaerales bacterium]
MACTRIAVAGAVILTLLVAGCGSPPTAELSAYRNAFDESRRAGEAVLLDHEAALLEVAALEADDSDPRANEAPDRFAFDVRSIADEESLVDPVGVRLLAWRTLERYNTALVTLAAGGNADAVAASVDGLVTELQSFPLSAVAGAAGEIAPFAAPVKLALEAMERAIAAKRFEDAIRAAHPAIMQFLDLLEADAQDFYDLRLALRDRQVDARVDRITDLARATQRLLMEFELTRDAAPEQFSVVIDSMNATLLALEDWPEDNVLRFGESGDGVPNATHQLRVEASFSEMRRLADEVASLDESLFAYRAVMVEYVRTLRAVRRAHEALHRALDRPAPPSIDFASELITLAVTLRRTLALYERTAASP